MRHSLEVIPFDGELNASIKPPGSKSITNRALLCAALAKGQSTLSGVLESDDSQVMIMALRQMGVSISSSTSNRDLKVHGCGGMLHSTDGQPLNLFVKNSGTTMRFLTAVCALAGGNFHLSGVDRMHERPIGDLVAAIQQLGISIETENANDCPPVIVRAKRAKGGRIQVRGDMSSQYLSGLLLAAPLASGSVEIEVIGDLISKPYVEMTQRVMQSFGVSCLTNDAFDRFIVEAGQNYLACDYVIEPDATAASYFWGAAAICGGTVTVVGLDQDSIQGDIAFAKCLAEMGCRVEFSNDAIAVTGPATKALEFQMSDFSDTVQTMAAVALFLNGPTTIRGVAHNRIKETDRIGNLALELRKLGARVIELDDGLTIYPGTLRAAEIETYDDHRMAMSLSLVGLKQPGVVILDPDCCAKTYPKFFADLESLRPGSK